MTHGMAVRRALLRSLALVRALGRALHEHDAIRSASAIAFHFFFSLVPLVALTGWAAHRLLHDASDQVLGPLMALAPRSVAGLADSEFMRLGAGGDAVLPPLSAIGFVWLSTDGVATAMVIFERMFRAPPRSWLIRRLVALGYVLLAVTLLSLASGAALLVAWGGSIATWIVALLAPAAALWLLLAVFFRAATIREQGRSRRGFRGALVTLLLWAAVSALFSLYVAEIASYSRFYGSLATVVVLLLWLWLMAMSLLIGGEVNARFEAIDAAAEPRAGAGGPVSR
jgi:membrane protein